MHSYEHIVAQRLRGGCLHADQLLLNELRNQLARLIGQKETLENHQKPMLVAIYNREIGVFEFKLLQLQAVLRRMKRKVEMLTVKANQGEMIDASIIRAVEDQLDREFAKWKKALLERETQLQKSKRLLDTLQPMSNEDSRKLKSIYRKICKLIHPDITASMHLADRFWMQAQKAYADGDIDQLEVLLILILKSTEEDSQYHIDQADDQERLQKLICSLAEKLESMKKQLPYCYADKIMDSEWVNQKQKSLMKKVELIQQDMIRYERVIKLMIDCPEVMH
ncbi:MAG: hypothetical protein ACE5DZ_01940 [Mariprofundus sp.]